MLEPLAKVDIFEIIEVASNADKQLTQLFKKVIARI